MKQINSTSPATTRPALAALVRIAFVAFAAALLGATASLATMPANAADVKLNAPCESLQTLDVTKVDNPQCKAVSAMYIGADGKLLYVERLVLDNEQLVSGRLVRVVKACEPGDTNCAGGCGRPGCFVCIGGRCGCLC